MTYTVEFFLPALAMLTMIALLGWSLFAKREAENRLESEGTTPSSLARDGDPHRIGGG
ncbi:MAG: hypothetical protein ACPGID_12080 [Rubricella sp.]